MLAISIDSASADNGLFLAEQPVPEPVAGQVLIQVAAAGVNRPDLMQRDGLYPPPPGASAVLGLEIAGTVAAVAAGVGAFRPGDRVCALVGGGGYAEYCVADAGCCLPLPDNLDFVQAAALPESLFTVWSNVFQRGRLQAGETLLVHGGGSGIGVAAIQLAKAFGARVFVTAGSADKCRRCLELGADAAIDYRRQDFVAETAALTSGRGVDAILDMVGGDYLPRNLKALAVEGRLLQIAIQHGARAEINLWTVMHKRLTLTGSTLRAREPAFKAAVAAELLARVWPLLAAGSIRPVIDSVLPLAAAGAAHERMRHNLHFGKIVLEV